VGVLYRGQVVNIDTVPCFAVGIYQPLPWESAIVLADLLLFSLCEDCSFLYILPATIPSVPGQPAYFGGSEIIIPLFQSSGSWELPVTGVNCDCAQVINVDQETWGSVKRMYQ
jgi:hypothetical protein